MLCGKSWDVTRPSPSPRRLPVRLRRQGEGKQSNWKTNRTLLGMGVGCFVLRSAGLVLN